jgi:hypothetical protein
MRHGRSFLPFILILGALFGLWSLISYKSPGLTAAQSLAEYGSILTESLDIVQSIGNLQDARLARPSLAALTRRMDAVLKDLSHRAGPQATSLAMDRFGSVIGAMDDECKRLMSNDEIAETLCNVFPFTVYEKTTAKQALRQLRTIDHALDIYYKVNGRYPNALADLAISRKGHALLPIDEISDPWGRLFVYDIQGQRHNGRSPDVWTKGSPCGENKNILIGNWMKDVPTKPPMKSIFGREQE